MKFIFICYILFVNTLETNTLSVDIEPVANFTHILYQYILMCGFDYICDPYSGVLGDLNLPLKPTGGTKDNVCPRCFCGEHCMTYDNCCPDLILKHHEMSCMNFSLFNERKTFGNGLVVSACPPAHSDDIGLCSGEYSAEDKFTLPPVSSSLYPGIVYRNQYCADCHGDNSTFEWNLEIACESIDLNHLRSYQEIYSVAYEGGCRMGYKPTVDTHFPKCLSWNGITGPGFVTSCNVTGTWRMYDSDLEFACNSSMFPTFGVYKNIFCSMCNPSDAFSSVIDTCANEGMSQDQTMEDACSMYPAIYASAPYKNIFCFYCNKLQTENMTSAFYLMKEEDLSQDQQTLDYSIKFDIFMNSGFSRSANSQTYPISSEIIRHILNTTELDNTTNVNMTQLLEIYLLHFGFQGHCAHDLLPGYDQYINYGYPCECNIRCVLYQSCCPDFALTEPFTVLPETKTTFSTVNRCYTFVDETIRDKCEGTYPMDGTTLIPVRSVSTNVPYKNIYCKLCNEQYEPIEEILIPMTLEVNCNFIIPWQRFVSISDLVTHLTILDETDKSCTRKWTSEFSDINMMFGHIPPSCPHEYPYDDIKWACYHFNSEISYFSTMYYGNYANIFCDICNRVPSHTNMSNVYSECNITGTWHFNATIDNTGCTQLPSVVTMNPYKNYFCKQCNPELLTFKPIKTAIDHDWCNCHGICVGIYDPPTDSSKERPIYLNTYRSIFSTKIKRRDISERNMQISGCNTNETYDSEQVWTLFNIIIYDLLKLTGWPFSITVS